MCVDFINIKSKIKNYKVYFEKSPAFINKLAEIENSVFIIDKKVYELYKDTILSKIPKEKTFYLESLEKIKNLDTVYKLYGEIIKFKPKKNLNLVSIGGGIIQDITGFIASTLYRGINWVFIPTTLLVQTDSCIGAKTSLNFKNYKNLIGTFYPPNSIYVYTEFLKTLSEVDYYSGVGEMAKLHLMNGKADALNFSKMLNLIKKRDLEIMQNLIKHSLEIKKAYIEDDEFDTGKRNLLNYGHCFGHAIETSTNFLIPHGQAVIIGIILANKYALKNGLLNNDEENFILNNILKPVLTVDIPNIDIEKTISSMKHDKKVTGNNLALVMLVNDYKMKKITDLKPNDAEELLKECLK